MTLYFVGRHEGTLKSHDPPQISETFSCTGYLGVPSGYQTVSCFLPRPLPKSLRSERQNLAAGEMNCLRYPILAASSVVLFRDVFNSPCRKVSGATRTSIP